jgi:hypothetical protein
MALLLLFSASHRSCAATAAMLLQTSADLHIRLFDSQGLRSPKLKQVLELTLALGNYLNANSKGFAQGFQLETLIKVRPYFGFDPAFPVCCAPCIASDEPCSVAVLRTAAVVHSSLDAADSI